MGHLGHQVGHDELDNPDPSGSHQENVAYADISESNSGRLSSSAIFVLEAPIVICSPCCNLKVFLLKGEGGGHSLVFSKNT